MGVQASVTTHQHGNVHQQRNRVAGMQAPLLLSHAMLTECYHRHNSHSSRPRTQHHKALIRQGCRQGAVIVFCWSNQSSMRR